MGGWRRLFKKSTEQSQIEERRPRAFLGWRGGSDDYCYHQQQHQQHQQNHQYPQRQSQAPPPDLPPDLPDYGDNGDDASYPPEANNGQQPPSHAQPYPRAHLASSTQQQQQHPNQYHPQSQGYPGDPSLPPTHPSMGAPQSHQYPQQQQQQQQQPPQDPRLPNYENDPMMMMNDVPDEPLLGDDGAPWEGEDENAVNEPDLSAFDKEYIMKGLARLYRKKILPLEKSSGYAHFHSPPLSPADFDAPPAVLLLGPFR